VTRKKRKEKYIKLHLLVTFVAMRSVSEAFSLGSNNLSIPFGKGKHGKSSQVKGKNK